MFDHKEVMLSFSPFNRPWDFSIQDTSEEVQLIFHMWIGLFYSRSTPRSFHLDSNCLNPYIKECDPLNVLTSIGQASTESFGPCLNVCGTSDALDLSKKDGLTLDLGSDAMDLSQKNALTNLHVEPQAKQRQTSGFDGLKEAGYGIEIAFESTTVQQKVSTLSVQIIQHYTSKFVFGV